MIELLGEQMGDDVIPTPMFNKLIQCLNRSQHAEINSLSQNLLRERIMCINNLALIAKCSETLQSYIVYDVVSDSICNGYLVPIERFE